MPTREDAWQLLNEYVKSESLVKHCLAVEAAMRAYARKFGSDRSRSPDSGRDEDVELWGLCGLLHDFDYEKYPTPDAAARTGHPFEGEKILRERGYPENVRHIILGHALYSGVPRDTKAARCLFAVDELCGFVMAVAHLRVAGAAHFGDAKAHMKPAVAGRSGEAKPDRPAVSWSNPFATLTVQSVEKRLKEKKFAAKVSREDIEQGIAELGVPRADHIQLVITALAGIAEKLFPVA